MTQTGAYAHQPARAGYAKYLDTFFRKLHKNALVKNGNDLSNIDKLEQEKRKKKFPLIKSDFR